MLDVVNNNEIYEELINYLKEINNPVIFFDIETFQYNYSNANKDFFTPTLLKNKTFSFATSIIYKEKIYTNIFNTFIEFLKLIENNIDKKISIKLVAQNNNKYDNHFLIQDCVRILDFKLLAKYSRNSINKSKEFSINKIKKEDIEKGVILEKRIKSSNNVEFTMLYKKIKISTQDIYLKTHLSIATLGLKLKKLNLIDDKYLKTSMDYEKYNLDKDMNIIQESEYSNKIYKNLSKEEIIYIQNDVIILALGYHFYNRIFPNFDINKMTLSSNILDEYLINDLSSFQLINQLKNDKVRIDYSNFNFDKKTLYDYFLKHFKGGLNFMNDKYIGKIIYDEMFSCDLNSSYPYVMYNEKCPTFLVDYKEYKNGDFVEISNDEYYYLYSMDKYLFNSYILDEIESVILQKIIVKYYSTNDDYVYFNSNTVKLLKDICKIKISKLPIKTFIKFETRYFGAKEIIKDNYKIKSEGKCKFNMTMSTPFDYVINYDKENSSSFSEAEIDLSKLFLNGIYGLPSLRKYFNSFYLNEYGEYENMINNHQNKSRNILFSLWVTSKAIYNLLSPLKYLTPKEIDENLIYCDTDSLYLKKVVYDKIPVDIYDKFKLGSWDVENETIDKFYTLNHKKYAYEVNGKIKVRSGGIRHDSFDLNMSFEEFISTQFSDGCVVENTKSIMNKLHTISIYPSTTKLKKGNKYPTKFTNIFKNARKNIVNEIIEKNKDGMEDIIYIETNFGTISQRELYHKKEDIFDTHNIELLKIMHRQIKNKIEKGD